MASEISSVPELIYYCEFDPKNWDDRLEITFSNEHVIDAKFSRLNDGANPIEIDFYIEKKKTLIPKGFFGKNILNVTSIVGKNGIGKTSIFNFIKELLPQASSNNFSKIFEGSDFEYMRRVICLFRNNVNNSLFFIKNTLDGDVNVKSNEILKKIEASDIEFCFYNLESDNDHYNTILPKNSIAEIYKLCYSDEDILKKFKDLFPFLKKLELKLTVSIDYKYIKEVVKDSSHYDLIDSYIEYIEFNSKKNLFKCMVILNFINNIIWRADIVDLDEKSEVQSMFEKVVDDEMDLEESISEQQEWIIKFLKKMKGDDQESEIKKNLDYLLGSEIRCGKEGLEITYSCNNSFVEEEYKFLNGYEYFLSSKMHGVFLRINGFSSGEEAILFQFSSITQKILPFKDKSGSLILFIDEYENRLHPEWGRVYLNYLLYLLNSFVNDFYIQIVITTHSPYLISDLPKENIRLIKKEKDKDKDKDKEEDTWKRKVSKPKHSFASNYYDILSDSFFLEDTIGEFAKQKINGWITELNELENSSAFGSDFAKLTRIDELKELIHIVDDLFIRNKLLELAKDVRKTILKQADKDLRASLIDQEIAKLEAMKKQLREESEK